MKIMVYAHESDLNGASKSLLTLIDHLQDQHEFWIVTAFDHGPFYDAVQSRGVHVLVCPFTCWMQGHAHHLRGELGWCKRRLKWYLRDDRGNERTATRLAQVIAEQGIDLLYTNTRVVDIGIRCSQMTGVPHILHVREFGEEDFSIYPLVTNAEHIARIKAHTDCIIYNSYAVMRKFAAYQFRNQYVVYNGVDRSPYETHHNDDKIRFLISGRISEAKGQIEALRAARILQDRGYHQFELWIAGAVDDGYAAFHRERQGLDEVVKVLGYRADMKELRYQSDVELVCSVQEAFGRVTVEAMMAGNPVIGSDTGGTPELIRNGENGFLYPRGDVVTLADRMQYLMEHIPQVTEMGACAREYAQQHFGVENYIQNMESILDSYDHLHATEQS